jgi:hypothetical protein
MTEVNNIRDFLPGARADIDAETVRSDGKGNADVLVFRHGRGPDALVIASVFAAKAWLLDGLAPPAGILQRFRPLVP